MEKQSIEFAICLGDNSWKKKIFSSQKFALSESGLVFILLPAHHILAQAKLDL